MGKHAWHTRTRTYLLAHCPRDKITSLLDALPQRCTDRFCRDFTLKRDLQPRAKQKTALVRTKNKNKNSIARTNARYPLQGRHAKHKGPKKPTWMTQRISGSSDVLVMGAKRQNTRCAGESESSCRSFGEFCQNQKSRVVKHRRGALESPKERRKRKKSPANGESREHVGGGSELTKDEQSMVNTKQSHQAAGMWPCLIHTKNGRKKYQSTGSERDETREAHRRN